MNIYIPAEIIFALAIATTISCLAYAYLRRDLRMLTIATSCAGYAGIYAWVIVTGQPCNDVVTVDRLAGIALLSGLLFFNEQANPAVSEAVLALMIQLARRASGLWKRRSS